MKGKRKANTLINPRLKGCSDLCCRFKPSCTSSGLLKRHAQRMRGVDRSGLPPNSLLGGHSELDPRLPIPNRTVKRLCADDSADCPRESRSPPGAQHEKAHPAKGWAFLFGLPERCPGSGRKRAFPFPVPMHRTCAESGVGHRRNRRRLHAWDRLDEEHPFPPFGPALKLPKARFSARQSDHAGVVRPIPRTAGRTVETNADHRHQL